MLVINCPSSGKEYTYELMSNVRTVSYVNRTMIILRRAGKTKKVLELNDELLEGPWKWRGEDWHSRGGWECLRGNSDKQHKKNE